ncbi:MAG TPA: NAD-dependent epimerase/dehydratase family protein [Thermoguttaceae bacterium]|nr:NAD-dependent epimerase/dehydratase family protein [Thermoguttaceae bacterium]
MSRSQVDAVTGAFGYSGKYIARRLLDRGHQVRTLTNSPHRRNSFEGAVEAHPFHFDDPARLRASLEGVSVLYNTYWVRFNHKKFTYAAAVRNTIGLFDAARAAGVRRIVHVSITNPSEDSPLEYFRGKARLERALGECGVSFGVLRPAVLFGEEDVLINNIAWALRRFPIFGLFGRGEYRLQPIYVDDLAELAVELGAERENTVIDAIGPETFTYRGLVEQIGRIIGKPRSIVPLPPVLAYLAALAVGATVRDVVITRQEIRGLMAGLLCVDSPASGRTRLTDWAAEHAESLGRRYASELARRRDRLREYEEARPAGKR